MRVNKSQANLQPAKPNRAFHESANPRSVQRSVLCRVPAQMASLERTTAPAPWERRSPDERSMSSLAEERRTLCCALEKLAREMVTERTTWMSPASMLTP